MSSKSKREKAIDKDEWQLIRNKFQLTHSFNTVSCYGYYYIPQSGSHHTTGDYTVFDECGLPLLKPTEIQGRRIVRDLKLKISLFRDTVCKGWVVFVYKYNSGYGGMPCCDVSPTPNKQLHDSEGLSMAVNNNYTNILGQSVFDCNDHTEHVICIDREVFLDSGDELRLSITNMPNYGWIHEDTTTIPPTYQKEYEIIDGEIIFIGAVECAVAYL